MTTKQPRLNVVLEPSIYETLYKMSKKEGMSMSLVARDLLREALTIHEDAFWAKSAAEREKSHSKRKLVRHRDVWKSS
jgi:predicted CopG family antitoxin